MMPYVAQANSQMCEPEDGPVLFQIAAGGERVQELVQELHHEVG